MAKRKKKKKRALSTRYRDVRKLVKMYEQQMLLARYDRDNHAGRLRGTAYALRIIKRAESAYQASGEISTLLYEIQRALGYVNATLTSEE